MLGGELIARSDVTTAFLFSGLAEVCLKLAPDVMEAPVMISRSEPIERLRRLIARVAPTEATVLIRGERGTGKGLVAAALHRASPRCDRAMVTIHCAALSPCLATGELFGDERRRQGLIAAAAGGTLSLDEVGDLSLSTQAGLQQFLETGEVRPLGATGSVPVDVRIIATTNRDLRAESERGRFRLALYDHLSEIELEVPPLRGRPADIPVLVEHFLALHARRLGVATPRLTPVALEMLQRYAWPGNVRELRSAIQRGAIFAEDGWIRAEDLGLPVSAGLADDTPGAGAEAHSAEALTSRQREALRLASALSAVRRRDPEGGSQDFRRDGAAGPAGAGAGRTAEPSGTQQGGSLRACE